MALHPLAPQGTGALMDFFRGVYVFRYPADGLDSRVERSSAILQADLSNFTNWQGNGIGPNGLADVARKLYDLSRNNARQPADLLPSVVESLKQLRKAEKFFKSSER